tara:strand:+ start:594 stop:728 length:135 start_codon:yes stop_codon:yes gene_type:complete
VSVSVYPNDLTAKEAFLKRDEHFKSAKICPREARSLERKWFKGI